MKYNKKFKIRSNLSKEFQVMLEGHTKKWGQKTKKIPQVPLLALGEEMLPRVPERYFWMCRLSFINVVCDILKSICSLYTYMFCLSHGKAKNKKKGKNKKRASLSAWLVALGEENKEKKNKASPSSWATTLEEENKEKKELGFPECLG
jgi:hypothetical protein